MKYIVFVALGLMMYYMAATEAVMGQLNALQNTYENFDQVAQAIAEE